MANGAFDPEQIRQSVQQIVGQGGDLSQLRALQQELRQAGAFSPQLEPQLQRLTQGKPTGEIRTAQLDMPVQARRGAFGQRQEDPRLVARRGLAQNLGWMYPELAGKEDTAEWWTTYAKELNRAGDLGGTIEALAQASSVRKAQAYAQEIAAERYAEDKEMSAAEAKQMFADEDKLRDEYQQRSKFYNQAVHGYDTIQAAGSKRSGKEGKGVDDMSLIFAYMKVLDPESVVREGEYATAQKTAGALEWFGNLYDKARYGAGLTENQRKIFIEKSKDLMRGHEKRQNQLRGQYKTLAERYNLRPENVLVGLSTNPTKGETQRTFSAQERDWIERAKEANPGMSEGDIITQGIKLNKIKEQ